MNEDSKLQSLLRRLAIESPSAADAAAEQRVLAAFRARHKGSRRPFYWTVAAACLALALIAVRAHRTSANGARPKPESITSGFVPLPYAQSAVPLEEAVIVRVKLQPSAWSALNVPLSAPSTGTVISADLLVGQDGVARAVRVVSIQ